MKLLTAVFLTFITFSSFSYPGPQQAGEAEKHAKEQAGMLGKAFVAGDFKTVAHYTYPEVVKVMGGPDGAVTMMNQVVVGMKQKGMSFKNMTIGNVTKMVKNGSELQCTIPQQMEIKTATGRVVVSSILIGISTDGGKNWTFVDAANKDEATIRKFLPHLSTALVIPPPQKPAVYKDK